VNVLPRISGREVVRALRKIGYNRDRQRGSHIVLRRTAPPHQRITLPDHKEVTKGTLKAIIRQTGLTVDRPIEPTRGERVDTTQPRTVTGIDPSAEFTRRGNEIYEREVRARWRRRIAAKSLPSTSRPAHMPSTRMLLLLQSASAPGVRMPKSGSCESATARCTGSEDARAPNGDGGRCRRHQLLYNVASRVHRPAWSYIR
jgi:predicted RNA binding protein YcfA (HicA-like mRNA interferase family)